MSMPEGSRNVQKVTGNEREAGFIGRGSRRGRISGALIHGFLRVIMEIFSQSPLVILTGKRYIDDSLDAITRFRSLQKKVHFLLVASAL